MASDDPYASSSDFLDDPAIAGLRERLDWFESFDRLMQSNVGNAGDILREAIGMREAAAQEHHDAMIAATQYRSQTLLVYRGLFSEMLDDITQLQGDAERLARRLTDAIDALEAELQPDVSFPSLTTSLTSEIVTTLESGSVRPAEIEESTAPLVTPTPLIAESDTDFQSRDVASEPDLIVSPSISDATGGRFTLLIHGVPKAATALSIKSYLEGLDMVELVEPREFAAGVLRLQLQVERNLEENDLAGWAPEKTMTTLHSRPGLLEIKMN